ncbi:MAG TPA: transglutaminase domain-containing protein [Patescibacteria group bacterium]|nr:transglutaminase domain-containing protein [Patescibacteria group bacterium]
MDIPKFVWEHFNHPLALQLRNEFQLEKVVESGRNEFEKQLLLKDWVYQTLPHGNNPKPGYQNAIEILRDAREGEFYCSHYSLALLQCATALGWYCRKLGVDYNHRQGEEERHHGVTDIWSNQFQKWLVIDPMHNLHFEKEGIPLNALEIRVEYLKNKVKDVEGVVGDHKQVIRYFEDEKGFDKPSNYFWFFILLKNNFFKDPEMYNSKALLWVDEHNQDRVWYKGGGSKGESEPHPMYKNQFVKTNNFGLCFPEMAKP